MRARLATDGGKSNSDGALLSFGAENVGSSEVGDWVCAFEVAMGTAALCVDNSLWDTLAVKV